jgi:hypothetical protein
MTRTPSTASASRPRWRSALATFSLVAALVATSAAMPANAKDVGTGPGAISGTVTSTDGQSLGGVSVSVSSASTNGWTTTDATGYYELSGITLNDETYISVWANGYQQVAGRFETLTEASPALQLDYVLTPFETGVGTVSGHITGDGTPLAGLTVGASDYSTGQGATSVTDENGFYQISGLANGQWHITAFAGNQYQTAQSPVVLITDLSPDASADIAFESYPSGTSAINGVVTDSTTGEPIAGVNINLFGTDVPQYGNATTNAAGEFSFELLPAGTFHLSFSTSGYLEFSEDIQIAADETAVADRGLIAKNSTASGHLQLADGTPVVGTYVQAASVEGQNWGAGSSDENGDYVIGDLGAIAYTLSVGGFGTPYDLQERTISAVANADVTASFTLVPRTTGSLIGYVYQPDGNAYLAPVCATLYSAKTKKAVAERYIDGEHYGSDEFYFENLKPGKYTVEIRDCDDDPTTKFDKVFLGGVKNFKDATFVTIAAAEDSWGHGIEFAPRNT